MSEKGTNHKESKIKKQLHLWVNRDYPLEVQDYPKQSGWSLGWSHVEEFQILPRDFLAYANREF